MYAAKQKLKLEQLVPPHLTSKCKARPPLKWKPFGFRMCPLDFLLQVVSKGKFKDIGKKTDKDEVLKKDELQVP